ncbi:MAG: META domain-containing protein [Bacteroidetes bacterium]|nr:META domain-containing protein [Bacteroidota bacterium]
MRKKILSGVLLMAVAGWTACKSTRPISPVIDSTPSSLSGVYTGTLPCADCEGIQTMIKLKKDGSYEREMDYLGKSVRPLRDSGRVQFGPQNGQIELCEKNNPASKEPFSVQGNSLTQLNGDGKPVTGPLASHFIFHKQASPLLEQYWELIAIDGLPIMRPSNRQAAPHIIFKAFGNRVFGHAGCNSFFGSFALNGSQGLSFSGMGATKKACPDMNVEDAFLKALDGVVRFRLHSDSLSLENSNGSSLLLVAPTRH